MLFRSISDQDLSLLGFILNSGRSLVIVVNKWDGLSQEVKEQVKDLPDSYKRYLMNYFRKSLDVMGSPIRIQFKEGENPYANKRNTLTPTQMRKRKRLMKHIKKNK